MSNTQYNATSGLTMPTATLYACVCVESWSRDFLPSICSVSKKLSKVLRGAGTW